MTFALCPIIDFDDRNYVFEFLRIQELNHCHHTSTQKLAHFLKQKCGNPTCVWLGDKEAIHVNPSLHERITDELPTFGPPNRHIIALSHCTAPKVQSSTLALLKFTYMYLDKCGSQLQAKAKFTLT